MNDRITITIHRNVYEKLKKQGYLAKHIVN